MLCERISEIIYRYPDITDDERLLLEKHIAECETCRDALEEKKRVLELASAYRPEPVDDIEWAYFQDALNRRIDSLTRRKSAVLHALLAVETGILVLAFGMFISSKNRTPSVEVTSEEVAPYEEDEFEEALIKYAESSFPLEERLALLDEDELSLLAENIEKKYGGK